MNTESKRDPEGAAAAGLQVAPVDWADLDSLEDTQYAGPAEQLREMIRESRAQRHQGRYFELLKVTLAGEIVGFMNLYAHGADILSCGPEIRPAFRRRGLGFAAEQLALDYAREQGYRVAVAQVADDNRASIALHEKLGFVLEGRFLRENGKRVRLYLRSL